MSPLQPWHDFFMLTGGASATLLGLVFVAASIAATIPNEKLGDTETRSLWVLPIVYAFLRVLVVSALGLIPGWGLRGFGIALVALGIGDLGRMAWVFRGLVAHHHNVEREKLTAADWRWYLVLPSLATVLAGTTGTGLALGLNWPLGLLAAALILHLTVGIHNAWELADWLVTLQ